MEWDESKHPRIPAGDSAGGQFGTVGSVSRNKFDRMLARQRMDHIKAGGTVADPHLTDLLEQINQPDGGFTYQPFTAHSPTEGFALSIHPERSVVLDARSMSLTNLVDFVQANRVLLRNPGNFMGAWHDPASGKVFLDVSTVTTNERQARQLALSHDQIAYYDLKRGTSVTVNKDATSGGVI
jgi:hypothetical protein